MKILQLSKKFPYPLKDGESIAVTYASRAMHALGAEITLLSMNTTKHPVREIPKHYTHYAAIHLVDVDNRVKPLDALKNLFSRASYHVSRFDTPAFHAKLRSILEAETFDVVQLETLYLAPYIDTIRKYSKAKIVMRSHNVEHEIWERVVAQTPKGMKQSYLKLLTARLRRYELAQLNRTDGFVSITSRDWAKFKALGCRLPHHVAPIGLDLASYPLQEFSFQKSCAFIGSLDWIPNVEGVKWLLKSVWPEVLKALPEAELHLAGRHTPDWLLNVDLPNVVVHGEVEDAGLFLQAHPLLLVPLFSGSGMRVKILEGMAYERAVLTTSIGLEGISAKHGESVLIAETAEAFAEHIVTQLNAQEEVQRLGKAARTFIEKNYSNRQIAQDWLEYYKKL